MDKVLIYVFDDFDTAARVREELLSRAFPKENVELTVREDEAGPVEGNFTVGNDPKVVGGTDYKETYANPRQRGTHVLTIRPIDATQAEYALTLLARYGVSEAAPAPSAAPLKGEIPAGAKRPTV